MLSRAWLNFRQNVFFGGGLRKKFSTATSPALQSVIRMNNGVSVQWNDHNGTDFHTTWLRYNCKCPTCVDANGQRILDLGFFQAPCTIKALSFDEQGLRIEWWEAGNHESFFPNSWLLEQSYYRTQCKTIISPSNKITILPKLDFQKIVSAEAGQLEWLSALYDVGAAVVTNAGVQQNTVQKLAGVISHAMPTVYGEIFDVVELENPINIAYSTRGLALHQDLVYYESPPGLQFLHCLRFDPQVQGGESTLMDGFALCALLRERFPICFETLCRVPATFQKVHYERAKPVHMTYTRPHIAVNHLDEITAFFLGSPI